jgi:hypothetical protein
MPKQFLEAKDSTRTPGMETTGPVPVKPANEFVTVEQLIQSQKPMPPLPGSQQQQQQQNGPQLQWIPMVSQPSPAAQPSSSSAAPPSGSGGGTGANK